VLHALIFKGQSHGKKSFRIAAAQAAPVFMDRDATIANVCSLIKEIGDNGAKIAVFPEVFIPTYPDWILPLSMPEAMDLP
jgi:predicted amidohydrolase